MERFGATGGASKARTWCGARDSAGLGGLVHARDGGEAIPPVVARIFSGDSTSPLTREARDSAVLGGWGFVLWKIKGAGMMLRLQYN